MAQVMLKIKTVAFSLLVLALLTDFSEQQPENTCRVNWVRLDGSCYKFGREMMTWQDAASMCRLSGGYLAEINTAEENTLIVNQIRTIHTSFYDHVGSHWIGSTDMFREGSWNWFSNDGWIGPFRNWAPGQPDNAGGIEHCLEIRPAFDYKWNDYMCRIKNLFVCETRKAV
ncbi:hypothetical protein BsWGS_24796 [Bradybaena similaris]